MEGSGGGWRCKVRHQSMDPCQEKKIGPVAYVITVYRVTCLSDSHPETSSRVLLIFDNIKPDIYVLRHSRK